MGSLAGVIENIYFTFTVLNSIHSILNNIYHNFIEKQLCTFLTHLKMCKNAVGILFNLKTCYFNLHV